MTSPIPLQINVALAATALTSTLALSICLVGESREADRTSEGRFRLHIVVCPTAVDGLPSFSREISWRGEAAI
jgi:hypothetical protein